jgi:drug/metabolite transporter (DMT)-like permease
VEYLIGVIAAILLGAGFVLQQDAAQRAPRSDFLRARLLADLLRQPRWRAGLVTMVLGQVLSAWVIGHLALSVAEPLLATNLVFALLLAAPLSKQRMCRSEIAGAVVLMAGVTALSLARSVNGTQLTVGSFSYWPYAGGAVAIAAYGLAVLGRRKTGDLRGTLTATSAGVVFGLQDALTRPAVYLLDTHKYMLLLASWPGWCLLAVSVVALWLMESAFNAAPLHATLPAITAAEPVIGIVLGVVVLGDAVKDSPAMIALQAAGFLALVIGLIMVARGPALTSGHRRHHQPWTDQAARQRAEASAGQAGAAALLAAEPLTGTASPPAAEVAPRRPQLAPGAMTAPASRLTSGQGSRRAGRWYRTAGGRWAGPHTRV